MGKEGQGAGISKRGVSAMGGGASVRISLSPVFFSESLWIEGNRQSVR
jgi:hypothetical protein